MKFFKNKLFNIYIPLLASFIFGKLVTQTDLLMLSSLGTDEVAAFSVPTRIMILDMIVAFSFAPVVSVFVASEKKITDKKMVIENCLSFSIITGVALMFLGLIFYPTIMNLLIEDIEINNLASKALLLLTIAIPFRLTQFVLSMILHASGFGKKIIIINFFGLILNFICNYVLMFELDFGFVGCYISTFICSLVVFLVMYYETIRFYKINLIPSFPNLKWIKSFMQKSSAEWLRLSLLHFIGLITLYFLGNENTPKYLLISFSAASELHSLFLMPLIAFMRAVSIEASEKEVSYNARILQYKKVRTKGFIMISIFSVILALFIKPIGSLLYSLDDKALTWWSYYMVFVSLSLSICFINTIYRGVFQSLKRFLILTKIEIITKWLIYIPLIFVGIKFLNPLIAWSGILLVQLVEMIYFYRLEKKYLIS